MRILSLADTHFGYVYGRTASARSQTSDQMFEVFSDSIEYAKKNKIDLILHGGDFFNRSNPKKEVVSRAYELVESIISEDIIFVCIPGNHDRSRLPETLLSYYMKNVHLINKFTTIELDDITVIGFPFVNQNPKDILKRITKFANKNHDKQLILLCHQLFDGAKFGPHNFVFRNRIDALQTFTLPRNILFTLTGHIHRAQSLTDMNVFYPGSLERTSFMEIVEPKGFLDIIIEDGIADIQFVENSTLPMEVIEIELEENKNISSQLEDNFPDSNTKTLLRLSGRKLSQNEIELLWSYFPTKEYPFLKFSPYKPEILLKSLYTNSKYLFKFDKVVVEANN